MDELLDQILSIIQNLQGSLDEFSDDELEQIVNNLTQAVEHISQQEQTPPPTQPQVPSQAGPLWVLSGANPDVFQEYLETFPDAELNAIARHELRFQQLVAQLQRQVTLPSGESSEGIPKTAIQSSNVYGFQYDPRSKLLRVKFQGNDGAGQGPIYEYQGVPPQIFKMFQNGAVPAKTTGSNRWGAWWRNKSPSIGASMHELIKMGGYPYQRIS